LHLISREWTPEIKQTIKKAASEDHPDHTDRSILDYIRRLIWSDPIPPEDLDVPAAVTRFDMPRHAHFVFTGFHGRVSFDSYNILTLQTDDARAFGIRTTISHDSF